MREEAEGKFNEEALKILCLKHLANSIPRRGIIYVGLSSCNTLTLA